MALTKQIVKFNQWSKGPSNMLNGGNFWFSKNIDLDSNFPYFVPSLKMREESQSENSPVKETAIYGGYRAYITEAGVIMKQSSYSNWSAIKTLSGENHSGLGLLGDQDMSSGSVKDYLYYAWGQKYLGRYDGTTWTDQFQTMQEDNAGNYVPMVKFLQYICIGNRNVMAIWDIENVAFTAARLTLPPGYNIQWMKAKSDYLIICAYHAIHGTMFFLWDGTAETYNSYFNMGNTRYIGGDVSSADSLYAVSSDGFISQLISNSYFKKIARIPDYSEEEIYALSTVPQAIKFQGSNLLIAIGNVGVLSGKRYLWGGIWQFNPITLAVTLKHSIHTGSDVNLSFYAIFPFDNSNNNICTVFRWNIGSSYYYTIESLDSTRHDEGCFLITEYIDGGEPYRRKKFVQLALNFIQEMQAGTSVIARYNTTGEFIRYLTPSSPLQGGSDYFYINSSSYSASNIAVGDTIFVESHPTASGNIRNVKSIEAIGYNYKVTIDEPLAGSAIFYTNTQVAISSFKKILPVIDGTIFTGLFDKILKFNARSKKIQIMIEMRNSASGAVPQVGMRDLSLLYIPDRIIK